MNRKTVLTIALMTALALPLLAQTESDFRVTLTDDNLGAVIIGYTGTVMNVRIPAAIQGYPVREIGNRAFANSSITSVVIPEGVVVIRDGYEEFPSSHLIGAFSGTSLTSITLPQSLTTIGFMAFFIALP